MFKRVCTAAVVIALTVVVRAIGAWDAIVTDTRDDVY